VEENFGDITKTDPCGEIRTVGSEGTEKNNDEVKRESI